MITRIPTIRLRLITRTRRLSRIDISKDKKSDETNINRKHNGNNTTNKNEHQTPKHKHDDSHRNTEFAKDVNSARHASHKNNTNSNSNMNHNNIPSNTRSNDK